jgi:hypothetical protein
MSERLKILTEPWHLVTRFFTSLSPRPPTADDERFADEHLSTEERALWALLSNQDRRHSAGVAQKFVEVRPDATRAEIAGALLHDVGKVESGLGTTSRVVATVVGPRTTRFRAYHDHEEIGAQMADEAGSDPATVELISGAGPAFPDLERCDH